MEQFENLTTKHKALVLLALLIIGISASVFAAYLNWEPEPLVRAILFALLTLAVGLRASRRERLGRGASILFALIALLFSVSMLYDEHIIVLDSYSGTIDDAYIESFGLRDALAFVIIALATYTLESAGFLLLTRGASGKRGPTRLSLDRVSARHVLLLTALLFVL